MRLRTIIGALALLLLVGGTPRLGAAQGPAVSAPNGKFEFDAGALTVPQSFVGRIAGALTLPLGDRFGIQADLSAATAAGFSAGGALHLFTRDPQNYLVGGTFGFMRTPGAMILAAGPEAELYLGHWTIEAWGGVAMARPTSGPDRVRPFGMVDFVVYPRDNLRLSAGLSLLDSFLAVHLGGEYQFEGSPFAVTGDARLGQDGSLLATVGFKAYLGTDKSLLRRNREDDPWDRGNSLFTALSGQTSDAATELPPPLVCPPGTLESAGTCFPTGN